MAVDLIGPWTAEIRDKWYEFNALASIDMVTNLVKLIRIDRKTSAICPCQIKIWTVLVGQIPGHYSRYVFMIIKVNPMDMNSYKY